LKREERLWFDVGRERDTTLPTSTPRSCSCGLM